MKNKVFKLLAVIMTVAMCIGLVPMSVFAVEPIDISVTVTEPVIGEELDFVATIPSGANYKIVTREHMQDELDNSGSLSSETRACFEDTLADTAANIWYGKESSNDYYNVAPGHVVAHDEGYEYYGSVIIEVEGEIGESDLGTVKVNGMSVDTYDYYFDSITADGNTWLWVDFYFDTNPNLINFEITAPDQIIGEKVNLTATVPADADYSIITDDLLELLISASGSVPTDIKEKLDAILADSNANMLLTNSDGGEELFGPDDIVPDTENFTFGGIVALEYDAEIEESDIKSVKVNGENTDMVICIPAVTGKTMVVVGFELEPKEPAPEISVSPKTAEVLKGKTKTFTATVENLDDTTVTWTVEGAKSSKTKIDENGKLTVGSDETAAKLTVKATANGVADGELFATATVTVKAPSGNVDNNNTSPNTGDNSNMTLYVVMLTMLAAGLGITLKKKIAE